MQDHQAELSGAPELIENDFEVMWVCKQLYQSGDK